MVKFCGVPGQPFKFGVTVKLATNGVLPTFVAIKLISPLPEAASPMAGSEFVQAKAAEAVPAKTTPT